MSTGGPDLHRVAAELRCRVVEMCHRSRTPHLGSALSCMDLLVGLYWGFLRVDPSTASASGRDRFILGKGHGAPALYAVLAARGFISDPLLDGYAEDDSVLGEHPGPWCVPGVEWATGSLGHGLSVGAGMAWAARLQGADPRTVVLLSDGECNEGAVWEAALLAAAQSLGSLIAIVDYNKWQATGRSNEVMALAPLREKWEAFGWDAVEIDGHDLGEIGRVLAGARAERSRPLAIVAHTIKGRGVSFMEDNNHWHYRIPDARECELAMRELRGAGP